MIVIIKEIEALYVDATTKHSEGKELLAHGLRIRYECYTNDNILSGERDIPYTDCISFKGIANQIKKEISNDSN